jgi:hypothetical protein
MKYYEVSFEEYQLDRQPKLWKFLVELPKSTQDDAMDESKAMIAANKAGGAELRTDFKIPMMEAKLVPEDAVKPDSESMTIDECRVWILQKPSEV